MTIPQGTQGNNSSPGTPIMGVDSSNIFRLLKLTSNGEISINATSQLRTMVDEASATITYVGQASATSILSDSTWLIYRVQVVAGVTNISYADSSTLSNKVWNDRATYTYL